MASGPAQRRFENRCSCSSPHTTILQSVKGRKGAAARMINFIALTKKFKILFNLNKELICLNFAFQKVYNHKRINICDVHIDGMSEIPSMMFCIEYNTQRVAFSDTIESKQHIGPSVLTKPCIQRIE